MDDVLCSARTLEEAEELQRQRVAIMQISGTDLHEWCANHENRSVTLEERYTLDSKS